MKVSSWVIISALILVWIAAPAWAEESGYDTEAMTAIRVSRSGMKEVVGYFGTLAQIFPEEGRNAVFPGREARLHLWQGWQAFLDHLLTLDRQVGEQMARFKAGGEKKEASFRLAYAAFLAEYRQALEFIALAERNPAMHVILNEPVPEIGLPEKSYARLKFRFLNVLRGAEFARLDIIYGRYGADPAIPLAAGLEEDRLALWRAGVGAGPELTIQNAMQVVQDSALEGWFPVQKGVAEWMGDTKVWRPQTALIGPEQIAGLQRKLEPGDVLLVRREWYLSNAGLPGFWPHAALYVGTAEERVRFFDDPAVAAWVKEVGEPSGSFENLLAARSPQAVRIAAIPQESGRLPRVLEAISEGVSFTTLEHAAGGDSLSVLRPRLSKTGKARAVLRAFHYAGRPYDFNFDFRTDAALVCTELVTKAFEADADLPGLVFPQREVLGRPVTPANEIARQFDEDFGTDRQQFDFVAFLDGQERAGEAVPAGLSVFRRSWQRPKWHILIQNTPLDRN